MKEIARAAVQGLGLYGILYFGVVHTLVFWKWETANDLFDGRYTVEKIINPDLPKYLEYWLLNQSSSQPAKSSGDDNDEESPPDCDEIEDLVQTIQSLPTIDGTNFDQATELIQNQTDVSEVLLLKGDDGISKEAPLLPEGNQTIYTDHARLDNLFKVDSLSTLSDSTFDFLVKSTLKELKSILDQDARKIKWNILNNGLVFMLDKTTGRGSRQGGVGRPLPKPKEKLKSEQLHEELCVLPPLEEELLDEVDGEEGGEEEEDERSSEDDDDEDADDEEEDYYIAEDEEEDDPSKSYVNENDLIKRFSNTQSLLQKRSRNLRQHFFDPPTNAKDTNANSKTMDRIMEAADLLEEQFVNANDILDAAVAETSDNIVQFQMELANQAAQAAAAREGIMCNVQNHTIQLLMDVGLNALSRHKNPKYSLLKTLREEFQFDSGTIKQYFHLEDTPISQLPTETSSSSNDPKEISALLLVDSPIIREIPSFVDAILDGISGHFDPLDQYMDQVAEQLIDVYNQDASTLGRVFVKWLLVQCGHTSIPTSQLSDMIQGGGGGGGGQTTK